MKITRPLLPLFFAACAIAATLSAQAPIAAPTTATCPSTATIDELMKAIDLGVSGPANKDRTCFRNLLAADARLAPLGKSADGNIAPHLLTADGWIEAVKKRGDAVLGETQVRYEVLQWTNLAHIWSTYELTVDGKPGAKGINSIQAFYDGKRWRILQILWQDDHLGGEIPHKFQPAAK